MKRIYRLLAPLILAASLAQGVEVIPPADPISQAPEALDQARTSLRPTSKKGGVKSADAYAAILVLKQAAEAYAAKGDPKQAALYYQETLRSLQTLAKAAPSFQKEDVARLTAEVQGALATIQVPATEERTIQVEFVSAKLQDGTLSVEWRIQPPDLVPSEVEKNLAFPVAVKLADGSTVKKLKTIKVLYFPDPSGAPNTFIATQDYVCPASAKSVQLGVEFFYANVAQQTQTF